MSSPQSNQRLLTYVDALREAVAQEMQRDPRVFVFGLDVDDHKAIQGSTRGLVDVFGPERVFGTPLSEDAMTGVAIGAAMAGMRPIHVHIRMDFLMLCMNQLVNIAAKSRYMYDGQVKVPLVVRSMIGKSWGQGAQHSQGLHAMFMHVPGLKVVAPSNAYDAKGCLIHAIRDDNPVIFVEHRLLYFTDAFVPEERSKCRSARRAAARRATTSPLSAFPTCWWKRCAHPNCWPRSASMPRSSIRFRWCRSISTPSSSRCGAPGGFSSLTMPGRAAAPAPKSSPASSRASSNGKPIRVQRMGYAPTTCPTTPALERNSIPIPRRSRRPPTSWCARTHLPGA